MELAGLLGGLAGLLGAAAALWVVTSTFTGGFTRFLVVRPKPDTSVSSKEQLLQAILALNHPDLPYRFARDQTVPAADLLAEWKLADATWWGIFNKSGFSRHYRLLLYLDGNNHEVRATEETASVSWTAGALGPTPSASWQKTFFKGIILFERSWERAYGITEVKPFRVAEAYAYDFDPWRVKGPVVRATVEHGWAYCPVIYRYQLRRQRAYA